MAEVKMRHDVIDVSPLPLSIGFLVIGRAEQILLAAPLYCGKVRKGRHRNTGVTRRGLRFNFPG